MLIDKASEENERNYYKIKLKNGEDCNCSNRRTNSQKNCLGSRQDQKLNQGERLGMIRFGSRVDMYFKNKNILAKVGQNVAGKA